MLRKLHLLLASLLLAGIVSAQGLRIGGPRVLPEIPASQRTALMGFQPSPRFVPRRPAIEVDTDKQMWWGYATGEFSGMVGFGASAAETYWGAMGVPTSESMPKGKTIKGVRFAITGSAYMKDFHLWIAEGKLPNSLSDVKIDIPVETSQLVDDAASEVVLPTPYAIPDKIFYIGYTFTITESNDKSNYPVLLVYNGADIDYSLFVRAENLAPSWDNQYQAYGPLAMQLLLEGDFPKNAIQISSSFNDVFALPGGTAEATVTLTSKGLGTIRSIDYIVGDANSDGDEQHLDIAPISGMDVQTTVSIPLKADASSGRTPRYITVTKVNGEDNAIENSTAEGYFVTLSQAVARKTVVEEFTGTWCGWCPRGTVGLEAINKQFPDKAITIAIHGDDPMSIDYNGISAPSYPYAYVDRIVNADPYYGITGDAPLGICDLVAQRNAILAEASVNLQQPTLSKNGNITFKTDITFHYSSEKAPYAIGYVLVADGLKGSGRDWAQSNFYSGRSEYSDDSNLKPWVDDNSYVLTSFDHVAIAAKGMDGSSTLAKPIEDGVSRTLNGSINLTGNTILQDFSKLHVVAILFNTENGSIVNADIQPVAISEDFSKNRMQVKVFAQTGMIKGTTGVVTVPVANYGSNGIHTIDYVVRTGSEESDTMQVTLEQPITSFGLYTDVQFPVPAESESGFSTKTIVITKVNGEENEATSSKTSTGKIMTVAKLSKRRTVVEEYTGTWCMWCPRGAAGLKRASVEYPDDAVLMAIHGGSDTEPMKVAAFNTQLSSVQGFPSANVNRYRSCDPYYGEDSSVWGLGAVIEDENSQVVEASVELQQADMDKNTGAIQIATDVTFQINRTSAPYLLAYVLVGDGLKGEGDNWLQTNAYATYYAGAYGDEDPYLREICDEWAIQADIAYDHVALAGIGNISGLSGSLKTTVEEGQVQTHTAKMNTKTNKLVPLAKELRVIAMLYDKTAKKFINADEKVVQVVDAVEDALAPAAAPSVFYNLAGQRLSAPQRGVNIINGRKVMVK
ncbi:MAG: hypothetical protein K6C30_06600 [Bacteroidaceae bacterium]|nr:hypothetical protein [Bacteroidaceae bacterium]